MTALMAAARYDRVEALQLLVDADAALDFADGRGKTALHWAAASNSADAVRLLLAAGTDTGALDASGYTPAALAVLSGAPDALGILLAAGEDANATNSTGATLLRGAAMTFGERFANIRVVNTLLSAGADASIAEGDGQTALFGVVDQTPGALVVFHTLVAAGADPRAASNSGSSVSDLAANRGAAVIRDYLRGYAFKIGQAELLRAVATSDLAAVRGALSSAADPNAGVRGNDFYGAEKSENGTADGGSLHLAALVGASADIVQALAEAGADPNGLNESGFPPLKIAAERGDVASVHALLAAGAEADGTADRPFLGMEPIHWAAMNGNPDVFAALIDAGANPSYTTNGSMGFGFNALGFAVNRGHTEIVAMLLSAGMDVSSAGETEDAPLDIAEREGWREISAMLRAAGGLTRSEETAAAVEELIAETPADQLWVAVSLDARSDVIGALLDQGLTPPPSFLRSVVSGIRDDEELVERLIEAGADVNATGGDLDPSTMLYEAAANGYSQLVVQLLRAGADPSIRNPDGKTAREIAEEYEQYDVLEIFGMFDE